MLRTKINLWGQKNKPLFNAKQHYFSIWKRSDEPGTNEEGLFGFFI